MIVYEMKLQGTESQYGQLDQAIRTGRFVRNSIIKGWIDGQVKSHGRCLQALQGIIRQPRVSLGKSVKLNGSTGTGTRELGHQSNG